MKRRILMQAAALRVLFDWLPRRARSAVTANGEEQRELLMVIGEVALPTSLGAALMQVLPPATAAVLLGAIVMAPISVFPWIRAPNPNRRLMGESFSEFFRDVMRLLKNRDVLIAIVLFIAPAATFSLTNFLTGLGDEFHAPAPFVGLVGGAGVLLGGICGCQGFRLIDRLLPLRFLYLAVGVAGSLFTLALIVLPHTPAAFAVALIGENVFQALAITVSTAIAFETIGQSNPLAATSYCLMNSAFNVPVSYMLLVDSADYAWHGIAGGYAADAGVSLIASLCLAMLPIWVVRRRGNHHRDFLPIG